MIYPARKVGVLSPQQNYKAILSGYEDKTRMGRGSDFAGENPDAKLKIPAPAGILMSTKNKSGLVISKSGNRTESTSLHARDGGTSNTFLFRPWSFIVDL